MTRLRPHPSRPSANSPWGSGAHGLRGAGAEWALVTAGFWLGFSRWDASWASSTQRFSTTSGSSLCSWYVSLMRARPLLPFSGTITRSAASSGGVGKGGQGQDLCCPSPSALREVG